MGYEVLSKIWIEFKEDLDKKSIQEIKDILEKTGTSHYNFEVFGEEVTFEMSGNKWVDYECLDKIKKAFNGKIQMINANEYVESDGGSYYYEDGEEV
ncbi:MAG: hypothetical protein CL811_10520 [Colwelliaceae bacterium]|jgi:hypothetical protein|nr:hypothetical protein [Colwelliaceae bacterium]|tara:strand:+ start:1019 stop:1309 length:291 start_codon:yes stop_codon:yes gene_type:complete